MARDTRVVFRKFKEGDVIALFPDTMRSTPDGWRLESYQHVGQHCEADAEITSITKLATKEEYADLLDELNRVGYFDLRVVRKLTIRNPRR